jgi:hypothetical protein
VSGLSKDELGVSSTLTYEACDENDAEALFCFYFFYFFLQLGISSTLTCEESDADDAEA